MKCLFFLAWMLLVASSCLTFGQERDSSYLTKSAATAGVKDSLLHAPSRDTLSIDVDTIPKTPDEPVLRGDTLLSRTGGKPPLDSIPSLPDSLKRRVVVGLTDPLDTLSNRLFAYQILDRNSYARLQVGIDTTLGRFDINNPVMRRYHAGAYLGNTGLSYYPIGFEARKRPSDFLFIDHVADYLHDPGATIYYQTQSPYTLIDYSSAGPKAQNESIFKLVHSQNVNKNWNVGLHYDVFSSSGQYTNQNAADNGFSLFSAYRGSQYSMYTNFNWNNVRMKENGGLENIDGDDGFMSTDNDPTGYSVRSGVGKTVLLNRSFYLMHSYSPRKLALGRRDKTNDSIDVSRFTLVQTFKYEWNKREFSDTATWALQGRKPYFGAASTHDSLYFRRIFNHFELMIKEQSRRKFTAGFSIGLLSEFDRYDMDMIPETVMHPVEPHVPENTGWGGDLPVISGEEPAIYYRQTKKHMNTAITGRFFNHTGQYLNWDFNGRLYFTGYKLGDLNINGTVQVHYGTSKGRNSLLLGGSIENAHPSYFLSNYASNWLAWDNHFNTSQEIRLRGEFIMPHRKLKLGAYVSQLNNYLYINKEAVPEQSSDALVTGTAYIEKDIRWWKFGFQFRLYGQYSSHEKTIPLPAFAGFQSTYFETWLVKNVLTMQLGWNVSYNTKYYAYAYMPSTGMFYLQEDQKIGNYPFFDLFLNFQIKRARIFVRTDGLNTMFSSVLGKENFMVYRYPANDFRMKFGVSWAFYD
ncbi:MAG: putative porin [Bacteroidales bacterium]|jgi:hypothetical protein|nr:putative porin [Bacteroidales bacterium]